MGWIEVTLMEFAGQAELFDAEFGLALRDNAPFTTTQLPIDGYEEGKFCRA